MAACEDIQDCLNNGCKDALQRATMQDILKAIGANENDSPYVYVVGDSVVIDGCFTFRQLARLGKLAEAQVGTSWISSLE